MGKIGQEITQVRLSGTLGGAGDSNPKFKQTLFGLVVDEKRKSKTTHMVLLEIIKEEGL